MKAPKKKVVKGDDEKPSTMQHRPRDFNSKGQIGATSMAAFEIRKFLSKRKKRFSKLIRP